MWENMKFKSERGSGSYLAAYFVFSVGMVGASTFAMLAFADQPEVAWYVLGIAFAAAILSLLLRRTQLPTVSLRGLFGSRRREICDDYTPRRRTPRSLEFGTNRPPTAEDVRDAANNVNAWVPHGPISGGRPIRKR